MVNAELFGNESAKTQAMVLGKSSYTYNLLVDAKDIVLKDSLKILGVTLDCKLTFKDHIKEIRSKVYAKVGALRRLKRVIPPSIAILLYKAYIIPNLEYCSPLMIGIGKTLNKKMESINFYALRTLLGIKNDTDYESVLQMADMRSP